VTAAVSISAAAASLLGPSHSSASLATNVASRIDGSSAEVHHALSKPASTALSQSTGIGSLVIAVTAAALRVTSTPLFGSVNRTSATPSTIGEYDAPAFAGAKY